MQAIAGNDASFAFNLQIDAALATSASAQMRISGPDGVLADWASVPVSGNPELFTVLVPASLNQLSQGRVREARLVELDVDAGIGVGVRRFYQDYVIVLDGDELVLMGNSFQSYVQALTVAASRRDLLNWQAASADDRKLALQSAYQDLCRINYDLATNDRDDVSYRYLAGWGIVTTWFINRLYLYTADDFNALLPDFKTKLCLAQVIEANARLATGTDYSDLRNQGVAAVRVGEQQTNFRQSFPLKLTLARETLLALRPYARTVTRVSRT